MFENGEGLIIVFKDFSLVYVPRDQNAQTYLFQKLARTNSGNRRSIILESLNTLSVTSMNVILALQHKYQS